MKYLSVILLIVLSSCITEPHAVKCETYEYIQPEPYGVDYSYRFQRLRTYYIFVHNKELPLQIGNKYRICTNGSFITKISEQ